MVKKLNKILNWDKTIKEPDCILQKMQEEEMKKPPHLRKKAFYVSCPCKRCRPTIM